MPTKNIVLCFPLQEPHVNQIREASKDDFNVIVSSQETIGRYIFDADIFCGHAKTPVDWAKVVEQDRLQWIQSSAAGLDHCLVPEVIASPIVVSGCSALFSNQVAETTMALLMGLIRRLPVFFHAQQARQYVRQPTDDLFGKSVAILGFGGNGQTNRSGAPSDGGLELSPQIGFQMLANRTLKVAFLIKFSRMSKPSRCLAMRTS